MQIPAKGLREPHGSLAEGQSWEAFVFLPSEKTAVGAVKLKLSQGPGLIRESAQGTHLYLKGSI